MRVVGCRLTYLFFVQTSASLGDQTLDSIDQSVVEASRFLQAYATDDKKRKCLEAFADCQKIVEWIRKVATGILNYIQFNSILACYRCKQSFKFCHCCSCYCGWWRRRYDNR